MTIEEKALNLAELVNDDDYNDLNDEDVIQVYTSFDKLMELVSEINSYWLEDLWFVNIDAFYVLLKHVNKRLVKQFEYNRNNTTLKEALMDCLLKYYELTKGK